MKYYYNGKLVRTSKHNNYTHAVIDMEKGKVIGCRDSIEKAQQVINKEIAYQNEIISNCESAIEAIEKGKTTYVAKIGRTVYGTAVNGDKESYEETIRKIEDTKAYIAKNYKIVELEAK